MKTICQIYLAILSSYHVISGVLSYFFSGAAMRFYKAFYGTDPVERRHLAMILKPWGALSIFAGIAGWSAVGNPGTHRGVVAALLVLLVLRAVYRIRYRGELEAISRISLRRNLVSTSLIAVGIAILSMWLVLDGGSR